MDAEGRLRVVFAGSRALELNTATAHLMLNELKAFDEAVILLRRPLGDYPRPFETLISTLASTLGFEVTWWRPVRGGRSATFLRDVQMVAAADEVLAFFPEDQEMSGGTGHVVEKALDQGRTVRAYAVSEEGLRWIGGNGSSEG